MGIHHATHGPELVEPISSLYLSDDSISCLDNFRTFWDGKFKILSAFFRTQFWLEMII